MVESGLLLWFVERLAVNRARSDDHGVLSKLTVVIPSFDRHEYLMRAIVFWASSPVSVIIVDGSSQPLHKNIQSIIKPLHNILYIHSHGSIAVRLSVAAKHLATDYVMTMGDDEFHLTTGLQAALMALERQPEVVGCIGQSIVFSSDGGSVNYGKGYPHEDYHIIHENVVDRVHDAMMEYNAATCYAVLRQSTWIRSYGALQEWSSPYAGEIQQALITYVCGKLISVNSLYWLRSIDVPPVHNSKFNRKLSFSDWWFDGRFVDEREKFVGLISNELLKSGCKSLTDALATVTLAIETYLKFCQRHKAAAATKNNRVGSFTRSLVRKFVSEEVIILLKKLVGRPTSIVAQMDFEFGTLDEFVKKNFGSSYGLSNDMVDEMRAVEVLITEFNHRIASSNVKLMA